MASLLEKVNEQEAKQADVRIEKKKKISAVSQIAVLDGSKDKQISAKVNAQSWEFFTRINKVQGLSNNSALNMIINKYIRENKGMLE
ncbi:MAG: hypothetical protein ACI4E3_00705 [Candidatus Fimousia sp.]